MDLIWQKFTDWLKEILIGGIKDALSGLFDTVNTRVEKSLDRLVQRRRAGTAAFTT